MKDNNKNILIDSLMNTIFDPLKEPISDYIELGIDTVLDSETLKQIPVVSTIVGFCKFGYNLHERHLINELIKFLDALNSGSIDKEKLKERRKYFEDNPKEMEKELSRILILLDRNLEDKQSIYIGKLYRAVLNNEITWDKFVEFSRIVSEMFESDFCTITNFKETICDRKLEYKRLVYLNLLSEEMIISNGDISGFDEDGMTTYQQEQSEIGYRYEITKLGKDFLRLTI